MAKNLYKPGNALTIATYYGTTGILAIGSLLLAPSLTGAAIAVGITLGLSALLIPVQKRFIENNLARHDDAHQDSPHLGEMADDLYKASGLSRDDNPIYSFRPDYTKKRSFIGDLFENIFDTMSHTHNAAALNLGKPVIMISEPLLKLLDDKEEKAVLAHEFAHAAARHSQVSLPHSLLNGAATVNNAITGWAALLAAGWHGIAYSVAAGLGAQTLFSAIHPKGKLVFKDKVGMSVPELVDKASVDKKVALVGMAVTVPIVTYFSPVYLGVFAALKGLSLTSKVVGGALSRTLEHHADSGAVELGADPLALITGLRKLEMAQKNSLEAAFKAEGRKMPKPGFLSRQWENATSTHPATESRIKHLAGIARKKGANEADIEQAVNGKIEVSPEHNMPPYILRTLMGGAGICSSGV